MRVLPRRDRFDRFVSVLVYMPRDRYDSEIRARSAIISPKPSTAACARSIRSSRKGRWCGCISSSAATRARRRIADRATLDRAVEAIVRSWTDKLRRGACARPIRAQRRTLFARYRDAFPIDYREVYSPATAVADIRVVEALTAEQPLGVELYRDAEAQAGRAPTSKS